jgi:hypothetical protein
MRVSNRPKRVIQALREAPSTSQRQARLSEQRFSRTRLSKVCRRRLVDGDWLDCGQAPRPVTEYRPTLRDQLGRFLCPPKGNTVGYRGYDAPSFFRPCLALAVIVPTFLVQLQ